jgi:hypothetical protein
MVMTVAADGDIDTMNTEVRSAPLLSLIPPDPPASHIKPRKHHPL